MITFYVSLLVFAVLTIYLVLVLLFGIIEKRQKRNPFGIQVGNSHLYFVYLNECIRVSSFFVFYIPVTLFAAYELFLYYQ
jgi:uncharacterized membrane protein YecN with MAPEG domain